MRTSCKHTARSQEERICELYIGKSPHVPKIYQVGDDAHNRQEEREAIDNQEQSLKPYYRVYEPC